MYRFYKIIFLLLISASAFGQVTQVVNNGSPKILPRQPNLQAYSLFIIPVYPDTATALAASGIDSLGMVFQIRSNGNWYRRDTSAATHKWTLFGSGGGGGAWGTISGTLSSQTDLQSALNLKLNISDTPALVAVYLRTNVAAATYATISVVNGKVNISDTSAMLNNYMRSIMAPNTIKGNNTGSAISGLDLTGAQVTAMLGVATTSLQGLAPAAPHNGMKLGMVGGVATWQDTTAASGVTFANPSASSGATAVNGSATTAMRSDAAPPIGTNVVTNALAAQMPDSTIKGNNTASTANAKDLTMAQVAAMLPPTTVNVGRGLSVTMIGGTLTIVDGMLPTQYLDSIILKNLGSQKYKFDSTGNHLIINKMFNAGSNTVALIGHLADSSAGNVSSAQAVTFIASGSGGGTSNFLRADGTWAAPAGGGGGSSLTRQSITSGTSGTGTSGNLLVTFNFTSPISGFAFTMPAGPSDQQVVEFEGGGTLVTGTEITTLTLIANTSQNITYKTPLNTFDVGDYAKFKWNASLSSWVRED